MRPLGRAAGAGVLCAALAGLASMPRLALAAFRSGAVLPLAASTTAPGTGAARQDYAVRLARPVAAGQKQLAVGSLESDDQESGGPRGDEQSRRSVATIRYVVATEILEVSPKGNARRVALTVRRLTKQSAGVTVELAKPGESFTARLRGRERLVEAQGAPVAPDLAEALAAAVPLRADEDPTDDDLFGSAERRHPGESWPVRADLFATAGAQRVAFDPKEVSGTATLAGLKQAQGLPCVEVRWQIEAHHGSFKPGSLPAGLLGTMSAMSVRGSAVVPVDAALQPVMRDTLIAGTGDFTATAADGRTMTLHRQLRQTFHVEWSRIP